MAFSEIEQAIAVEDDADGHLRQIVDALTTATATAGATIDHTDALRLLMIYALKYEKSKPGKVAEARRFISERAALPREYADLVDTLLAFGGAGVRTGDLFGTGGGAGGFFGRMASAMRSSVSGVQNVFTRHSPYMVNLLQDLARNRLKLSQFPYTGPDPGPTTKFTNVIVFVIGGCTYEEAAKVAAINAGTLALGDSVAASAAGALRGAVSPTASPSGPPFRVILGGTSIQSSSTFLVELKRMQDGGVAIDMDGMGGGSAAGGAAGAATGGAGTFGSGVGFGRA